MIPFPYFSIKIKGNIFNANIGVRFGNDFSSLPFRFVISSIFDNSYDFEKMLQKISPIKVKPGKIFDFDLNLFPIDQFDQCVLSTFKNE